MEKCPICGKREWKRSALNEHFCMHCFTHRVKTTGSLLYYYNTNVYDRPNITELNGNPVSVCPWCGNYLEICGGDTKTTCPCCEEPLIIENDDKCGDYIVLKGKKYNKDEEIKKYINRRRHNV